MKNPSLLRRFEDHVTNRHAISFAGYEDFHRWSVDNLDDFWAAVWEFDDVLSRAPFSTVLASEEMPGAKWFPGTEVNYACQVFRHVRPAEGAGQPAIIAEDESGNEEILGWDDLRRRTFSLACELQRLGVERGDRVAAYLPNRSEAAIAFLACASIGAIWAICAPDMGAPAILDRFRQVAPRILIATNGARYAGKSIDCGDVVAALVEALPSVEHLVVVDSGHASAPLVNAIDFASLITRDDAQTQAFEPVWLPFDHPLWILFSSGTTGKPKAIVHGHGGIILNSAVMRLHWDLRPSYDLERAGARFHWYCSTGWMVWNAQIGGLLSGTTICLYDGSPSGSKQAVDWGVLWRFAARHRVTLFGSGAQFFTMCARTGLDFASVGDLSALEAIGSTASPLPAEVQLLISERLSAAGFADHWWLNSSGGTDICGTFCTGNRDLPPTPGAIQCRQLGAAVESWSPDGKPSIGSVGELVCVKPLPSMPLYFWGDANGERYRASYFDLFPGIWRHGDWIRIDDRGYCEILGRSDATINRGGHRMGSSEIYSAIEAVKGVADSLVIDVRISDGESELIAFLVRDSAGEDRLPLEKMVSAAIRSSLSPRFQPDRYYFVSAIPRTLSTKKQELPIKRLFEGAAIADVLDPAAMANPECLNDYVSLAASFRQNSPH